jgi:predicted component of type VI protein secretion system
MPLLLKARGTAGESFLLPARDVVIGRSPQADWVLPDPTQQLSSAHARVECQGDVHHLVDTSTNGTLVNGVALTGRHRLRAGDVVRMGGYELVVEEAAPARPAAMDLDRWGSPAGRLGRTEEALAQGLAVLLATCARQRRELGVAGTDPAATNPLATDPERAAAALAASATPVEVVRTAVTAVETHHATVLQAVQDAFRATHDRFAPEAVERAAACPLPLGEARDAALWRAHVAAFAGEPGSGFTKDFAIAFRQAYERRSGKY